MLGSVSVPRLRVRTIFISGMVLNRTIQIRLTKDQYDRIKAASLSRRFEIRSSYPRYAALHRDELLDRRVEYIYRILVGEPPSPRGDTSPTLPCWEDFDPKVLKVYCSLAALLSYARM
jgi:hypothetical protein